MAVVLIVCGGTGIAVYQVIASEAPSAHGVDTDEAAGQLAEAIEDGDLSDAEFNDMDELAVFFAVFKTAAQEPIVNMMRWDDDEYSSSDDDFYVYNTTYDFAGGDLAYEYQAHVNDGKSLQHSRCVDGDMHFRVDREDEPGEWYRGEEDNDHVVCGDPDRAGVGNTDRLGTGGLSKTQADAFVSAIVDRDIIKIVDSQTTEQDGQQFMRFDVELTPVAESRDGQYYGIQQLMWAYHDAGLDPAEQLYGTVGAGKHGVRMQMYADPETALPVYSQAINTPGLSSSGQWLPDDHTGEHAARFEYRFPDEVPRQDLDDAAELSLSWPAEEFPPTTQNWKP